MATQYRIRYYSNGGPVSAGNPKGWPVASKSHHSLLAALKAYRDAMNDPRVGSELGIGLQYRLFSTEPWHTESPANVDRYAKEMNLKNWINRDGSVSNSDSRNRSGSRVEHAWPPGEYLSHGFYKITDGLAGKLARASGGKLPKPGYELNVALADGRPATLIRTPLRHDQTNPYGFVIKAPKRGWVWALYGIQGYNHAR